MDGAAAQQVNHQVTDLSALRAQLRAATLRPEADASGEMLADLSVAQARSSAPRPAPPLGRAARADKRSRPLVDRMLEQFPLDSAQGKALMSLAEALLRTPDPKRADQLMPSGSPRCATPAFQATRPAAENGFTLLGAAGRLLPEVSSNCPGNSPPPASPNR